MLLDKMSTYLRNASAVPQGASLILCPLGYKIETEDEDNISSMSVFFLYTKI